MITIDTLKTTKPDLAFIGTGWIGLNRMNALLKEEICNPVAILEPDKGNAQKALTYAKEARLIDSYAELLESKPQGIVISTPSALHAQQCINALKDGIAVFCQKPLARSAIETLQVIGAASSADRLLGVDLSYRYTDGMQKIYQLAQNNELGKVYAIDLVFHNAYGPDKEWFYKPKLSGGGCVIDLGIHLIDLAMWVLNFPAIGCISSALFSKGRLLTQNDPETIEDFASVQMETKTGVSVRLTCSWNLSAGQDADIRASFFGTQASALFYNIGGSFYDFEAALCHGTKRRIISQPPDEWGGRALINWTKALQESNSFRKEAFQYFEVADIIDRIYHKS